MKNKIRWVRFSYWVGAIADFLLAVLVLIPDRMGVPTYVYPMGLMSAVAFSWGVLLIVADRKPVERKWVLPPTALVVFLLGIAGVHAASAGLLPWIHVLPSSIAVVVLLGLLVFTIYKTR